MLPTLQKFAARELSYLLLDELKYSKEPFEGLVPDIGLSVDKEKIQERLAILNKSKLLAIAQELGRSSSIWVRQTADQIASRLVE